MPYFTDVSDKGPVRGGQYGFSISVFESPGDNLPIGVAHPAGRTADGFAPWRLVAFDHEIPGRWVMLDRQFIKVP